MARGDNSNQQSFVVAASLDQLAKSKDSPLRFQAVDQRERQKLANARTRDPKVSSRATKTGNSGGYVNR